MISIREGVFETNSSSMHAMTYNSEPRDRSEFPLPDADGILHVEIKRYWTCGCDYDDTVTDIIEYLCAQSVFSSERYVWNDAAKTQEVTSSYADSHVQCLAELRRAYETFGLPQLNDFICYARLADGTLLHITEETLGKWNCPDDDELDASLPTLAKRIGVAANCLTDDDFDKAMHWLPDQLSDERMSVSDLLLTKSTLEFYRT